MAKASRLTKKAVVPFQPMVHWKSEKDMLKALEQAKGELRLEGLDLTAEEEELLARRARGELSEAEFSRLAVELAKRQATRN